MRKAASAIVAFALAATLATLASQGVQWSFEKTARSSDVIAIGTVISKPEMGEYDDSSGGVVTYNVVRVDRYLKGMGPTTVRIRSKGGKFIRDMGMGPQEFTSVVSSEPPFPEEGAQVLFSLLRVSEDLFVTNSASHGMRECTKNSSGVCMFALLFGESDVMTPAAKSLWDKSAASRRQLPSDADLFGDFVSADELPTVIERVLQAHP